MKKSNKTPARFRHTPETVTPVLNEVLKELQEKYGDVATFTNKLEVQQMFMKKLNIAAPNAWHWVNKLDRLDITETKDGKFTVITSIEVTVEMVTLMEAKRLEEKNSARGNRRSKPKSNRSKSSKTAAPISKVSASASPTQAATPMKSHEAPSSMAALRIVTAKVGELQRELAVLNEALAEGREQLDSATTTINGQSEAIERLKADNERLLSQLSQSEEALEMANSRLAAEDSAEVVALLKQAGLDVEAITIPSQVK